MASKSIVLYDIPCTLGSQTWSGNVWKTRYALNFKGLSYRTEWVEYPDIADLCKKLGAPPTNDKDDGRPAYTLPVIHDLSTGAIVVESGKIAAYLDATYPDTPRLMPPGTWGLYNAWESAALALTPAVGVFAVPPSALILNPRSRVYFEATRKVLFGKPLTEVTPPADSEAYASAWQKFKDVYGKHDAWIRANGEGSVYLTGDKICYADLWMAASLKWFSIVMPEKWEEMKTWHGGRWARLAESVKKYEAIL
ncbi:hypothetical protein C8R46DRAFT_1001546 [Mycena filopes]|nr:hypothetical protein C8R46DRAFT_1001546 [Mycena filopes]